MSFALWFWNKEKAMLTELVEILLKNIVTRGIGLIDLAALAILGYTTVKKLRDKQ